MKFRAKVLLAFFGIGLALVIGFAGLRLFRGQLSSTSCQIAPGDWKDIVGPLVKDYHFPCDQFRYREPEDIGSEIDVQVQFNNFGLHGPDYTLQKPPGVFRVLIVGDSFPQALQVEIEQGFPYLLQQQLNQHSSQKIEVINLSVDAYGTDRELLLYAALGWQFQPDLVLLSFYTGNDVQDNDIDLETRRYGYRLNRPFFTLGTDGQSLQLHNSPVFDPALFSGSPAYSWLTTLQANQTASPPENPPEHPLVIAPAPNYTLEYPVELGLYLPEDAHWTNAWKLTEALILQFRNLVKIQNIPFAALIIPDRRAVQAEDWSDTIISYGKLLPVLRQTNPTAPNSRLEKFLFDNNIPALDLTWTLRSWAQSKPQDRLYFADNGHFNANGHAIAAERISSWLRSLKLTP